MIDDRHAQVGYSYFKRGDFQSPNWVCCPFSSTFARLVQITSSHVREELFFVHEKGFNTTPFSLIAAAGLFASQSGDLIVQRANNVREPFDPRRRPLASWQEHFYGLLIAKQGLIVFDRCAASKDVNEWTADLVKLDFLARHAGISI